MIRSLLATLAVAGSIGGALYFGTPAPEQSSGVTVAEVVTNSCPVCGSPGYLQFACITPESNLWRCANGHHWGIQ